MALPSLTIGLKRENDADADMYPQKGQEVARRRALLPKMYYPAPALIQRAKRTFARCPRAASP